MQSRLEHAKSFLEVPYANVYRSKFNEHYDGTWWDRLQNYDIFSATFDGWFSDPMKMRNMDHLIGDFAHEEAVWIDLLVVDCAIRRYLSSNEQYPDSLAELIPEFLSQVLQDPFGDGPMTYVQSEESYLLYSFGHNRQDDEGKSGRFDGDLAIESKN